jgi:hypothetical protein
VAERDFSIKMFTKEGLSMSALLPGGTVLERF